MLANKDYEYFELKLPNILVRRGKDRDTSDKEVYKFDSEVVEKLVTELALQHPTKEFVATRAYRRSRMHIDDNEPQVLSYSDFDVWEGKENLGDIGTTSRGGELVYYIENHRISKARERGSAAKTKDIQKAIKIFNKNFGVKSIEERMREDCERGLNSMRGIQTDKRRAFNNGFIALTNECLAEEIMGRWEEFSAIAKAKNFSATALEDLPKEFDEYKLTTKIFHKISTDKGYAVTIYGNDYAVKDLSSTQTDKLQILAQHELPEWMKGSIGMLKLIEPDNYLRDVGFRASPISFFLIDKEGDNNG
jgi:hypothetical protein